MQKIGGCDRDEAAGHGAADPLDRPLPGGRRVGLQDDHRGDGDPVSHLQAQALGQHGQGRAGEGEARGVAQGQGIAGEVVAQLAQPEARLKPVLLRPGAGAGPVRRRGQAPFGGLDPAVRGTQRDGEGVVARRRRRGSDADPAAIGQRRGDGVQAIRQPVQIRRLGRPSRVQALANREQGPQDAFRIAQQQTEALRWDSGAEPLVVGGNQHEAGLLDRLAHRATALPRRPAARQIAHELGFRPKDRRERRLKGRRGAPPAYAEGEQEPPEAAADGEGGHLRRRVGGGRMAGAERDQRRDGDEVAGEAGGVAPDPRQDRREAPRQREGARRPDVGSQKDGDRAADGAADDEAADGDKAAACRPAGIDEGDPEPDQGGPGQLRVRGTIGRQAKDRSTRARP